MVGLRQRLEAAGLAVATIDYPYRVEGRSRPDRFERLVSAHLEAFGWVEERAGTAPLLVGKSMGGRIGSHLEVAAPGLVFFGYPLVAAGRTEPRPTSHLVGRGPMLFIQGERDALAPQPLISAVVRALPQAAMEVIPGADHTFRTPRSLGVEPAAMLDRLAGLAIGWIDALPAVRSR
jgi:predicted alpha/beta-hydrolase family hydrolase